MYHNVAGHALIETGGNHFVDATVATRKTGQHTSSNEGLGIFHAFGL